MSMSEQVQCQRKAWSLSEDQLLQELRQNKGLDWIEVAKRIGGRNPSQCAQRWKRIKGFKLRKQWCQDEDEKLKSLVKEYGYHWSKISKLLPNRSGKQIREHYLNQLHPDLNNDPWNQDEDEKIIELYNQFGGKWSVIQKQLRGRSENSIKNRFYSYLRSKHFNIKNPYYIVPEQSKQNITQQKSEEKINQIVQHLPEEKEVQTPEVSPQQYPQPVPMYNYIPFSSVNCLSYYQMVYPQYHYQVPQCYMSFAQPAFPYL